jgi:predicted ATPase/class 3 adenylate cyclase
LQIADCRLQIDEPNLQSAALRAAACALAMTEAMAAFAALPTPTGNTGTLALKVAVATGSVRRFLLGDPGVQLLDTLAGATLDRLSVIGHLAERADVLMDEPSMAAIGHLAGVREWRADEQDGTRAAVLAGLNVDVAALGQFQGQPAAATAPNVDSPRSWLPPAVYARMSGGAEPFLAELRPAVALMLQFRGFDHERDDASARLDDYIRQVQQVVMRYGGILVDLTMADKGGYLYAAFGAPVTHEDDDRRAIAAALELQSISIASATIHTRIGLSRGTMRAGPYGSATRRAYGVLGDEVNLACRLMSHAAPGEVLASGSLQRVAAEFEWLPLPAIRVKGKREPVTIFQLLSSTTHQTTRPIIRPGTAALIGRTAELALLSRALDELREGIGRVVAIEGEPGIGKSRLIAETAHRPPWRDLTVLAGCGQSVEQSSYRAWRDIFMAYFELSQSEPISERQARVQAHVAAAAPELIEHMPLLNELLNIRIPNTHLTRSLDTAQRSQRLDELLVALLRVQALAGPLMLVLEDAHWLDAHSWRLAISVARAVANQHLPMLMTIVLRSLDATDPALAYLIQLLQLPQSLRLVLGALPADQSVAVAAARLGVDPLDLPEEVAGLVRDRAGGNPLFAVELIAALRDEGLLQIESEPDAPYRQRCRASVTIRQASTALPNTLQGLILSRIDRLPPEERSTLNIASVIGPTFEYALLHALRARQAAVGEPALKNQLRALAALDFTWLETPAPQLAYRFKHILTQEAAYQSLLHAQRREIHGLIVDWYEQTFGEQQNSLSEDGQSSYSPQLSAQVPISLSPYLAFLAHHSHAAEDVERERRYMALLGEQAISIGAFDQAIGCFERALALTPADALAIHAQRGRLTGKLARTYWLLGQVETAEGLYRQSCALAEAANDQPGAAEAAYQLGALAYRRASQAEALHYLQNSLELYRAARDAAGEGRALNQLGAIYIELGNEDMALACYQQALILGRNGRAHPRRS